jgi:hypothetical protein
MREIRLSGSEGGGPKPIASPYPYLTSARLLLALHTLVVTDWSEREIKIKICGKPVDRLWKTT